MVRGAERARRRRRWVGLVSALLLSLAILPWLTVLVAKVPTIRGLAEPLRFLYGLQCHQRASRSFTWLGQSLPVCARCTGIYLGLGLAVLVGRPRLRPDPFKAWFLVGALVVLLDVATERVGLRPASAGFRAATGAFLAYGIALALLLAAKK